MPTTLFAGIDMRRVDNIFQALDWKFPQVISPVHARNENQRIRILASDGFCQICRPGTPFLETDSATSQGKTRSAVLYANEFREIVRQGIVRLIEQVVENRAIVPVTRCQLGPNLNGMLVRKSRY